MGKHNYKNEFKNLFEEVKTNLDNSTIHILEELQTISSRELFDYWDNISDLLFQRSKIVLQQISEELQKSEENITYSSYLDDYTIALENMGMSIRKYPESEYMQNDYIDRLQIVILDLIKELKITGQTIDFFIELSDIKNFGA